MSDLVHLTPAVNQSDQVYGSPDAPYTLVEYGDYECPDTLYANAAVNAVLKHFGERVRYVFRHYPLRDIHPHAQDAAEAAESAATQGKFWEMHKALFAYQAALDRPDILRYAVEAGIESGQIALDLAAHTYAAKVQADVESGDASQIQGTPTFYVNGVRYDGDWEADPLIAALEAQPST